jgi:formamidopyrimidine-DNA glycosylase
MPELPEVEVTCAGIRAHALRQRIKKISVRQPKLRWPVPPDLLQLSDVKITNIERRAKYILFNVTKGTIIIHLGMSGRLGIFQTTQPIQKHDHVDLVLENNSLIRYTDPRRFGAILWTTQNPLSIPLLTKLGVEPLSELFDGAYLFNKIKGKKVFIKQFIMDQQIVVGVGNIYANEALFLAKISPCRMASTLSKDECNQLAVEIKNTLQQAILQGGTTFKDFLSPSGKRGYFLQKLFVYGRGGKHCFSCKNLLQTTRIGQRTTVFCQHCQR